MLAQYLYILGQITIGYFNLHVMMIIYTYGNIVMARNYLVKHACAAL